MAASKSGLPGGPWDAELKPETLLEGFRLAFGRHSRVAVVEVEAESGGGADGGGACDGVAFGVEDESVAAGEDGGVGYRFEAGGGGGEAGAGFAERG